MSARYLISPRGEVGGTEDEEGFITDDFHEKTSVVKGRYVPSAPYNPSFPY